MADLMQQVRKTLDSVKIPPLIGPLADLPDHVKQVVEAYGRACVREAISAAMRAAPEGPATHYHCAEGIQGTLSRLRRYAKQGDNKNTLQGQTMEEAAAFIEHALAARQQGVKDGR